MAENKIFENLDGQQVICDKAYYLCVFIGCNFTEQEIGKVAFEQCEFRNCNFSMAKLAGNFSDTLFKDCKLIGTDFTAIGALSNGFVFDSCCLDYANFLSLKLWRTCFRHCKLIETNFDKTDLTSSVFDDCNLMRATFNHTNLTKVDFTTAYNFAIHPNHCHLKKTKFSESGLQGLVAYLDIVVE